MVSLFSIIIQFAAIGDRDHIISDNPVTINMFSFIFSMGILVSFFKLMSDILVIYGAKKVSGSLRAIWRRYDRSQQKNNNKTIY